MTETETCRITERCLDAANVIAVLRWLDPDDYPDEECPFKNPDEKDCPDMDWWLNKLRDVVSGYPFTTMEHYALNTHGGKYLPHQRLEILYSYNNHTQLCVMLADVQHADFKCEMDFLRFAMMYAYTHTEPKFFGKTVNDDTDFNKMMMDDLYKISTCSYRNKNEKRDNPNWVGTGKWVFNGLAYQHYVINNETPEDEYNLKWEEEVKATFNPATVDIDKYLDHQPHRSIETFCCCLFPYESIVLDKTYLHFAWERDKTLREIFKSPEDFIKREYGDDTPDFNKLMSSKFSFSSYPPVPVSAL